ncbi:MAG: hypothetical protein ACLGII_08000 [Gammaproteobacteria bacterium]
MDFAEAGFAITRSCSSADFALVLTFDFTLTFVASALAAVLPALEEVVGAGLAAGTFFDAAGAADLVPDFVPVPVLVLLEPAVLATDDDFLIPTLSPFGKSEEIEVAPNGAALLEENRALYQPL